MIVIEMVPVDQVKLFAKYFHIGPEPDIEVAAGAVDLLQMVEIPLDLSGDFNQRVGRCSEVLDHLRIGEQRIPNGLRRDVFIRPTCLLQGQSTVFALCVFCRSVDHIRPT